MNRRSRGNVSVLGFLALGAGGCGASSDDALFANRSLGTFPDATATGGTPSFGGSTGGVGAVPPLDGSVGAIVPAGPGAGGTPGMDSGSDAPSGPHASGGSGARDSGPHCTSSRFYLDQDGDGFGDAAHLLDACTAPPHYVSNSDDCYDGNANAHPGQTAAFEADRGDSSFDYDCNGVGSVDVSVIGRCGSVPFCSGTPGWRVSAPECGKNGTWMVSCTGLTTICGQMTEMRVQKCR